MYFGQISHISYYQSTKSSAGNEQYKLKLFTLLLLLCRIEQNRIEYILLPNQGPFRIVKNVHIYTLPTLKYVTVYYKTTGLPNDMRRESFVDNAFLNHIIRGKINACRFFGN